MLLLPEFSDDTFQAFDEASTSIGEPATDRLSSYLALDANEWDSDGDGESCSLVTNITEEERLAFAILHAAYLSELGWRGEEHGDTELGTEQWIEEVTGTCFLVWGDNCGFHSVVWYATEEEARKVLAEQSSEWHTDEELCVRHGAEECNDPFCVGNVMLSEVRDTELWGGTE